MKRLLTALCIVLLISSCSHQEYYNLVLINKTSHIIYESTLRFGKCIMGPVRLSLPNTHTCYSFMTDPVPDEAEVVWETEGEDRYNKTPKVTHKMIIPVKEKIEKFKTVKDFIFTIKAKDVITLEIKYR